MAWCGFTPVLCGRGATYKSARKVLDLPGRRALIDLHPDSKAEVNDGQEQSVLNGFAGDDGQYRAADADEQCQTIVDKLEVALEDVSWDYEGLQTTEGEVEPLPRASKVVTAVIERQVFDLVAEVAAENGWTHEPADNGRQYPDNTLHDRQGNVFAVDCKTGRWESPQRLANRLTLGSHGNYFCNPRDDHGSVKRPYADYDCHLVAGVIYEWNPEQSGHGMVVVRECFVRPKWQIASRKSGAGTTTQIGSIESIPRILAGDGEFSSREDFETYWRDYGE